MTALTKAVRESVSRSIAELAESISEAEVDSHAKVQTVLRQRDAAMESHAAGAEKVSVFRAAADEAEAFIERVIAEAREAEGCADALAIDHLAGTVDAAALDAAIAKAHTLRNRADVLRTAAPSITARLNAAVSAVRLPADAVSDLNTRLADVRAEVSVLIARERLGC